MNIANIALDNKITVSLRHPNTGAQLFNADNSEMSITISGIRTKEYQDKAIEFRAKHKLEELLKKARLDKATEQDKIAYIDATNEVIKETALACIESLNIDDEKEGEKLTAKKLLKWLEKDSHKWIADQVVEGVKRGEDFIKA